jgi:hypothetical protein
MLSRPGNENVERAIRQILSSAAITDRMDECCDFADYRAFKPDRDAASAKLSEIDALSEFFLKGSPAAAAAGIARASDPAMAMIEATERLASSGLTDALVEQVVRETASRNRGTALDLIEALAFDMVNKAIERRMSDRDNSEPFDAFNSEGIIVCYIPGFHQGMSFASTMTAHDGTECTPGSVIPDAAFERFLRLLNVSSDDYIRLVKEDSGIDLIATGERWREVSTSCDATRGPLLSDEAIIDGLFGSPYGFTPLVSFRADPRFLIERDWTEPMTITGGMIGLHDFVNGSGNPQRFDGSMTILASPSEFIVGEGRRFGFDEVYGFGRNAFKSRVSDSSCESRSFRP